MFQEALFNQQCFLTEGSMFERLRRDPRIEFDPQLAHAALVFDPTALEVLQAVHREYIDIGHEFNLPMIAFTDTWRANSERIERSQFSREDVNDRCAEMLCDLREEFRAQGLPVFVGGTIGCRGDAYKPGEALAPAEARNFHQYQIQKLGQTDIDFLFAATLPAVSEALGMAQAMSETNLPYLLSFVIRPDGTVLDGTSLAEAIQQIDAVVARPPTAFFVNCVHPTVMVSAYRALSADFELLSHRIVGLQANTSVRSPEELDVLEDLETEDPQSFAQHMMTAREKCDLKIVGGCCGTESSHMLELAKALRNSTVV